MIVQKKVKLIAARLAKKYNLPEEEVIKMVQSHFALVKRSMKEGVQDDAESFKNVRIMNLGMFAVKPGRIEHLKNRKKK